MKRLMSIFTRLVGPGQHQHGTGKRTQRSWTLGPNRTRLGRLEVLEDRRMLGLASAMTTSLISLRAPETTIDVAWNDPADDDTVGFRDSTENFYTLFLQAGGLGALLSRIGIPTGGPRYPRQVDLGTIVTDTTPATDVIPNFSPGTIEISSNSTDLAIQGDGFFIVEGGSGEQLFTRNGIFKLNAENELVNMNGNRVLGYGIDESFQIQEMSLVPLSIPLGNKSVAQSTENVFLEGTLSPTGDLADAAEVLHTARLGSDLYHTPVHGTDVPTGNQDNCAAPITDGVTSATGGGGALTLGGRYRYKFVYYNANTGPEGAEGTPAPSTETFDIRLDAAEDDIQFNGLGFLTPPSAVYTDVRIYRTAEINGGGDPILYRQVGQFVLGTASWTDDVTDAAWADGRLLDQDVLNGAYRYYMTLANVAGGPGFGLESRPTLVANAGITAAGTRIRLDDLPVWGGTGDGGWTHRRIYRSLSTDSQTFHYVGEIDNATVDGVAFTDRASDAEIRDNATLDFDGPPIINSTPLVSILVWDGVSYDHPFQTGTLQFAPRKGGRQLATKEFTATATTTALELSTFMNEAAGIRSIGDDPLNPLPDGDPSAVVLDPGTTITADGRFQLVGNNGVDNALDIRSSGLQVELPDGTTQSVSMPFRSIQTALGESAVAEFLAYDTLGIPLAVRVTTVLVSRNDTSTTYRWFADSSDNSPTTGAEIGVGTGLITFDGEGNFLSSTAETVSIERRGVSSNSPLEFDLNFSQISGLYTPNSSLAVSRQDGSGAGTLANFNIGEDGIIRGTFSNGMARDLGQIRLARFENPDALGPVGDNLFIATAQSGPAVMGNPQEADFGSIVIELGDVRVAGDANGDSVVDMIDFAIWNAKKFTTGTDWETGDFNGDGVTDLSDFNIWNAHKFTSETTPDLVPPGETDDDVGYWEITISELARIHESERIRCRQPSDAATLAAQAADRLLATYWS